MDSPHSKGFNVKNEPREYGNDFQLRAQAGVWAVASQLALRGHVPCFPGLDVGYDIVLGSGLKLQVKSAALRFNTHMNYPQGAYGFNLRRGAWDSKAKKYSRKNYRSYSEVADFFVLWGVDEDRFFIVPTENSTRTIWFGPKSYSSNSRNKVLYDKLTAQRLADMEDRWDLLDVNSTSNALIESATVSEVVVK